MAGYWNLSRIQQQDMSGRPLAGALAYFFEAGTTTPMTVYQDSGLALEHGNPVEADGYGRFPTVFFDDATFSFYRQRVTTAAGVLLFDDSAVAVIGQSVGEGGAETPIDPNAVADTGDLKWHYGTGTLAGWVRCAGRTLGSSTSGATERANADTQPLFEHLWNADANLTVSGGRGANAAADFAANKTIALPDARRAGLFGLSDMGNSALSGISGGTTLGRSATGTETHTLVEAELPVHDHTLTMDAVAAHGHPWRISNQGGGTGNYDGGLVTDSSTTKAVSAYTGTASDTDGQQIGGGGAHTPTGTVGNAGSDTAHNNMPPFMRVTLYIRL